jgi:translation initiation factor IF-3
LTANFDPGQKGEKIKKIRINDEITAPKVRLIDQNGQQVGIVPLTEAQEQAKQLGLDLVEIAPESNPSVVKILDYAKYKYELANRKKMARRNQASTIMKEVRFRLKIGAHDYEVKINRAQRFLKAGDKVKIGILFRGREQQNPQLGFDLLTKISQQLEEFGTVDNPPSLEGRNLSVVLTANAKKVEDNSSQRQLRIEQKEARLERLKKNLSRKQPQGENHAQE